MTDSMENKYNMLMLSHEIDLWYEWGMAFFVPSTVVFNIA